ALVSYRFPSNASSVIRSKRRITRDSLDPFMSSLTKIPAGVQYFFDDEVKLRRHVEHQAMQVFAAWSYDEIILPMFDYHDLFARGMGAEKAEHTYRFVDRDGALLALRPELTSLVARTVATRFKDKAR